MTPRSIRRAAERKAAKQARKHQQSNPQPVSPGAAVHPPSGRHALTGQFRLIGDESVERFAELRDALHQEHQPQTATEIILVDRLAEHLWLVQRAQRFQNEAAGTREPTWFALMLRYETHHDRAFHRCLAELRTMRRERRREQAENRKQPEDHQPSKHALEFESQKPEKNAAAPKCRGERLVTIEAAASVSSNGNREKPSFASEPNRSPDVQTGDRLGAAASPVHANFVEIQ